MKTAWLVVAVLLVSPLAGAKGGKGKGKGHGNDKEAPAAAAERAPENGARFSSAQKNAFKEYVGKTHGKGKCPPGLAKKGNGCLPPGQEKKSYVVGQPLPPTVTPQPVPPELVVRIGDPPPGFEYVVIEGDLVQLAKETKDVVDVIVGLFD